MCVIMFCIFVCALLTTVFVFLLWAIGFSWWHFTPGRLWSLLIKDYALRVSPMHSPDRMDSPDGPDGQVDQLGGIAIRLGCVLARLPSDIECAVNGRWIGDWLRLLRRLCFCFYSAEV